MFETNVADKYASAVTKTLGLECNSRPCSAGRFLTIHLSSVFPTIYVEFCIMVNLF